MYNTTGPRQLPKEITPLYHTNRLSHRLNWYTVRNNFTNSHPKDISPNQLKNLKNFRLKSKKKYNYYLLILNNFCVYSDI